MINVDIQVQGLNTIQTAFAKRPEVVKRYINQAIEASIFEVERNATDTNFEFKTPRSMRTGFLQRSFKFGIVTRDFFGSIGPTANYAARVHENNPFMSRIAFASQSQIQKHFETALKYITDELGNK